ncbi:hypothetical protein ACRAVF_27285 [Bradyrhizobium oligotrophicum S58]
MPMTFQNPVNAPSTRDYAPPTLDFSPIANLKNTYDQSQINDQQKQLNAAKIQQTERIADLQKQLQDEFAKTGQIDYRKAAGIIAAMGNPAEAMQMLQQQPAPLSPLFGGGSRRVVSHPRSRPSRCRRRRPTHRRAIRPAVSSAACRMYSRRARTRSAWLPPTSRVR